MGKKNGTKEVVIVTTAAAEETPQTTEQPIEFCTEVIQAMADGAKVKDQPCAICGESAPYGVLCEGCYNPIKNTGQGKTLIQAFWAQVAERRDEAKAKAFLEGARARIEKALTEVPDHPRAAEMVALYIEGAMSAIRTAYEANALGKANGLLEGAAVVQVDTYCRYIWNLFRMYVWAAEDALDYMWGHLQDGEELDLSPLTNAIEAAKADATRYLNRDEAEKLRDGIYAAGREVNIAKWSQRLQVIAQLAGKNTAFEMSEVVEAFRYPLNPRGISSSLYWLQRKLEKEEDEKARARAEAKEKAKADDLAQIEARRKKAREDAAKGQSGALGVTKKKEEKKVDHAPGQPVAVAETRVINGISVTGSPEELDALEARFASEEQSEKPEAGEMIVVAEKAVETEVEIEEIKTEDGNGRRPRQRSRNGKKEAEEIAALGGK